MNTARASSQLRRERGMAVPSVLPRSLSHARTKGQGGLSFGLGMGRGCFGHEPEIFDLAPSLTGGWLYSSAHHFEFNWLARCPGVFSHMRWVERFISNIALSAPRRFSILHVDHETFHNFIDRLPHFFNLHSCPRWADENQSSEGQKVWRTQTQSMRFTK